MNKIQVFTEQTIWLGNNGHLHIAENSDGMWNIEIKTLVFTSLPA